MYPRVDRQLVLFLAALLVVVLAAVVHRRTRAAGQEGLGASVVAVVVSPLQQGLTGASRRIGGAFGIFREIRTLYAENRRLRGEVDRLRQRVNTLEEQGRENVRLREMLRFREGLPRHGENALAATVIGVKPTNWYNAVTIDRGTADGVRERNMVLTPRGLVGQVRVATPHTATVLLITDLHSGVGGRIQRTGWTGVVKGTASDRLEMVYLPEEAAVRPGDRVVTSGQGSVFQVKGIMIGTVEQVRLDRNTSTRSAVVRPAVDVRRLEEVFVLTE
ncbi:MAG: rod shape-determining protein MreC [Armatimonadetes bacterium]|jgi:rod shape-determining protein MreC|nr:rod shape-determining protein MreC [Armatimonadota bacterium]